VSSIFFSLVALLFCAGAAHGQQPGQAASPLPKLTAPSPGLPLPGAETLTYQVDWRLLPAGTVTMRLEQHGTQEQLSVTAATLGSISLLYRVSDRFQTVFDRATGCSQTLSKQTEEGRRRVNTDVHFDYARHRIMQSEKNLGRNSSKTGNGPLPECATDILSSIFYIATQPLSPGQGFSFPLADSLRTVGVDLKVQARENVKVPAGSFNAVRVEPTAEAGIVRNRGQIWIWYSDDARHIPVLMKARLFWGTVTLRLTNLENK
jgi:hypothetical protein